MVNSIRYDPVITTSNSSWAEVEPVVAMTGILYVPALTFEGAVMSTEIFSLAFGATCAEVACL